jgi:hypothetical protein
MSLIANCRIICHATGSGQFNILPGPSREQPRRAASALPDQLEPAR